MFICSVLWELEYATGLSAARLSFHEHLGLERVPSLLFLVHFLGHLYFNEWLITRGVIATMSYICKCVHRSYLMLGLSLKY